MVTPAQRAAEERIDAEAEAARAARPALLRHRSMVALISLCLAFAVLAGSYLWWLVNTFDDIPRTPMGISSEAGASSPGTDILVMGSRSTDATGSVSDRLTDGPWRQGELPISGFFWIHLPDNGSGASVVSIPDTMWIDTPRGELRGKRLRDMFSDGGPQASVKAVETALGIRFDHAAVFDWRGLGPLTEAVDGIRVYVPEATFTANTHESWLAGENYIKGDRAVAYQISMYDLPVYLTAGTDRAVWQQSLIRAMTDKLFIPATIGNPLRLTRVVASVDDYVTVDSTWTTSEMRSTLLRIRTLAAPTVDLASIPTAGPYLHRDDHTPPALSVDVEAAASMVDAVRNNRLDDFLDANPQWRTRGITAID